jgi:hypothetical protein
VLVISHEVNILEIKKFEVGDFEGHGICPIFVTMKMNKPIILFFSILLYSSIYAQTPGKVDVSFDPGVEGVLGGYSARALEDEPQGFRVQICTESGNSARDLANGQKAQFYNKYEGKKAYLEWESPNFKVRVGDFKNRLEATLFWKQLSEDFPAAYVVMDEIKLYKAND